MNRSPTVCVDASFVIRLVMFPDDVVNTQWRNWTEQGVRLVAPALLFYEVVNGIYQYRKHNVIDDTLLNSAIGTATAFPIEITSTASDHRRAAQLAVRMNLQATYNAHYLALAERMSIDYWTGDKRLVNVSHRHGLNWVHLI